MAEDWSQPGDPDLEADPRTTLDTSVAHPARADPPYPASVRAVLRRPGDGV